MSSKSRDPLAFALLATLLYLSPAHLANAAEQPNIIFILVDDLGPEWVSCYGAEEIETPNIDRLAATGMRFETAYSMAQCTPTRVTLLTGQYPFRHGWVNHWDVPRWGAGCHFDPEHNISFARLLRDAGYATAVAGKWQINDFRVQPDILRRHGFDEWCMWTGFEADNPPSAERYWNPYIFTTPGQSHTYEGKFGPDIYNEFVLDFLKRHRDQPMLVYYPMALTHPPLVHTPDEPDAEGMMPKHKAMVRYTDTLVGKVVKALDDLEIRRRTIVFFTTDNGTSRGINGRMNGRLVKGGKGSIGENGLRQPFIVNGPGMVPRGVVSKALTDFTDILPTFVELAGAKLPEGVELDGYSIAPVILGQTETSPRTWIMGMGHGPARLDERGVRPVEDYAERGVRGPRYKVHVDDGKITKLFDLAEDPGEQRNLVFSRDAGHLAALDRLWKPVAGFPKKDARPRYDPAPPQPWDMTIEDNKALLDRQKR